MFSIHPLTLIGFEHTFAFTVPPELPGQNGPSVSLQDVQMEDGTIVVMGPGQPPPGFVIPGFSATCESGPPHPIKGSLQHKSSSATSRSSFTASTTRAMTPGAKGNTVMSIASMLNSPTRPTFSRAAFSKRMTPQESSQMGSPSPIEADEDRHLHSGRSQRFLSPSPERQEEYRREGSALSPNSHRENGDEGFAVPDTTPEVEGGTELSRDSVSTVDTVRPKEPAPISTHQISPPYQQSPKRRSSSPSQPALQHEKPTMHSNREGTPILPIAEASFPVQSPPEAVTARQEPAMLVADCDRPTRVPMVIPPELMKRSWHSPSPEPQQTEMPPISLPQQARHKAHTEQQEVEAAQGKGLSSVVEQSAHNIMEEDQPGSPKLDIHVYNPPSTSLQIQVQNEEEERSIRRRPPRSPRVYKGRLITPPSGEETPIENDPESASPDQATTTQSSLTELDEDEEGEGQESSEEDEGQGDIDMRSRSGTDSASLTPPPSPPVRPSTQTLPVKLPSTAKPLSASESDDFAAPETGETNQVAPSLLPTPANPPSSSPDPPMPQASPVPPTATQSSENGPPSSVLEPPSTPVDAGQAPQQTEESARAPHAGRRVTLTEWARKRKRPEQPTAPAFGSASTVMSALPPSPTAPRVALEIPATAPSVVDVQLDPAVLSSVKGQSASLLRGPALSLVPQPSGIEESKPLAASLAPTLAEPSRGSSLLTAQVRSSCP